jgi:hypothetical protein
MQRSRNMLSTEDPSPEITPGHHIRQILEQIISDKDYFDPNHTLSFQSPGDKSQIFSQVTPKDMIGQIPSVDAWTLYFWFLICHPKRDGNGRLARSFLNKYGIQIPIKKYTTYTDTGNGLIANDPREHIDRKFANHQREIIFRWLETHWIDHQTPDNKNIFIISPEYMSDFKTRLEQHPINRPEFPVTHQTNQP